MKVFQSKHPVVFCWCRRDITFLPGQLIKVPDDNQQLQLAIANHGAFQEILDSRYEKVSPQIHQIKPPPLPPRMMSREDLIGEIMAHGVRFDPYSLDEQLIYQVHMMRTIAKKRYLTVINEKGNPVFISDMMEIENKLNAEEINRVAKKEEQQRTLPVATNDQYRDNNEKQKTSTIMSIQRDNDIPVDVGDSLRPQMVPNSFEVYDRNAMTVEQYLALTMQKQEQHRVDIALERAEKDIARRIELALPEVKHVVKIDKEIADSKTFDEIVKENVNNKGMYDITKVTYENFRYLIEPKYGAFCTTPLNGAELVAMRDANWKQMYLPCLETLFRSHGYTPERIFELKRDPIMLRANFVREGKRLYAEAETDLICFEINMLQRRYLDIESIEPNLTTGTGQAMKRGLGMLKKYGLDTGNYDYKSMDRTQLRNLVRKVFFMAKWGRQLPKTIQEMDEILLKWGHDKVVYGQKGAPDEVEETTPQNGINNGEEIT